jgi:hypothetical protein
MGGGVPSFLNLISALSNALIAQNYDRPYRNLFLACCFLGELQGTPHPIKIFFEQWET